MKSLKVIDIYYYTLGFAKWIVKDYTKYNIKLFYYFYNYF